MDSFGEHARTCLRALMVSHAALGNISKVAATYERCVQTLREELGVEPSEQTIALFEQLRNGTPIPSDTSTIAYIQQMVPCEPSQLPSETSDLRVTNLPMPLTSFIGREEEITDG